MPLNRIAAAARAVDLEKRIFAGRIGGLRELDGYGLELASYGMPCFFGLLLLLFFLPSSPDGVV